MYSALQRMLLPSKELLQYPYLVQGEEVNDYNIILALTKSGLFDDRDFGSDYLTLTGRIMLLTSFVLILLITVCALIEVFNIVAEKGDKKRFGTEHISLWLISIVLIASEVSFCFSYPVVCTESFRYIAPVIVPAAVWSGRLMIESGDPKSNKAYKVLSTSLTIVVCAFVITVILFYGASPQYHLIWNDLLNK